MTLHSELGDPRAIGDARRRERGDHPYRVFVRDLVVPMRIGVYANERGRTQRVAVSVDMALREVPSATGDRLERVFSYEPVVDMIRALAQETHVNLVETVAGRVADFCLADARVAEVSVRVVKLDVVPDSAGVGCEIVRRAPILR